MLLDKKRVMRGKYEDMVDLHVRILLAQDIALNNIVATTKQTKGEAVSQAIQLWINSNKDILTGGKS